MTNPDPLQLPHQPLTSIPVLTEDFVRRNMATVKGASREAWKTQCKLKNLVLFGPHKTIDTGDRRTPVVVQMVLKLRDHAEALPPGESDDYVRVMKLIADIISDTVKGTRDLNGKALMVMTKMLELKQKQMALGAGDPSEAELETVAGLVTG